MARTQKKAGFKLKTEAGDKVEGDGGVAPSLWQREFGADAFVSIWRKDEFRQQWVTHGRLSPADAEADAVGERFGGGHYRVQLKDKNEEGTFVIRETHEYRVPGEYREPKELPGLRRASFVRDGEVPVGPAPVVGTIPVGSSTADIMNAGILQLFQSMQNASEMNHKILEAGLARKESPVNWDLVVPSVVGLVTTLITAFASRKPDKDPMEIAREIAALMKESHGKPSEMRETVGAIKELLNVKDLLSPESGPVDPLMTAIPQLAQVLMTDQAEKRAARARAAGVLPRPNPLPVPPEPKPGIPPVPDTRPSWIRLLQEEGPKVVAEAAANRDPGFVAEMVVNYGDDAVQSAIADWLAQPDAGGKLIETVPALAPYGEWVAELVDAFREELFPSPEPVPEDEAGALPGYPPDGSDHA